MEQLKKVNANPKRYLPLLLEADPSEEMIERYLKKGTLYVLEAENKIVAVAVVVCEKSGCELKNLAVAQDMRGKGYGRKMVEMLCGIYAAVCRKMCVGTADIPCGCKAFYEKLGFRYTHTVKNFFLQYQEPIYENGALIQDMAYFEKEL